MDTRLPLIWLCSLPALLCGQTVLVDTDFTNPLGENLFGYAWAQFDDQMLWNESGMQTLDEGGRVEFAFNSTAAGDWFGGAVGIYASIYQVPEGMLLSDLSLFVDVSALGGIQGGNGTVRIQVVFEDSTLGDDKKTLLQLRTEPISVGEVIQTVEIADLSTLPFLPNADIGLTVEDMEVTAASALQFDGILLWLEVESGPGSFGNSVGNSISMHQVTLTTPLSLPEPDPIGAGDYPFDLSFEQDLTQGWALTWLGWVWVSFELYPFIYSSAFDWLYFVGNPEGLYYYEFAMDDWKFTNSELFPFVYSFGEQQWVYSPLGE